ncbi:MAG: hypothetical protein IPF58_09650 [Saprospirales bacterium]|nr:hypothetical protein [Saprospirales bacterium]
MINKGAEEAESLLKWLDVFEDDYYIEPQRHEINDLDGTGWSQERINQQLIKIF